MKMYATGFYSYSKNIETCRRAVITERATISASLLMAVGIRFFHRRRARVSTQQPPHNQTDTRCPSVAFFSVPDERLPHRKPPLWRENRRPPDGTPASTLSATGRRRARDRSRRPCRQKRRPAKASGREMRRGEGRRGMTGQVRPVTSWMISAGPDARATGANADAYVSVGATRIRAVGACPSRLLPSVPRSRSSVAPRPLLHDGALPSAASTSVPLWPAITRTRMNPNSSPLARRRRARPEPIARNRRRKRRYLYSCTGTGAAGKMRGPEGEGGRKIEERHTTRAHTKLYHGESNLPAVTSIGDFHAEDAPRIAERIARYWYLGGDGEKYMRTDQTSEIMRN